MSDKLVYAAVQNGVILDVFPTKEEAVARANEEIKKDWVQIICKKALRKLLTKSGDVALHKYSVIAIVNQEEIK